MALTAAADKVILAARPYIELLKNFSTNFAPAGDTPYGGVAVQVLSVTAGDFGTNNGYNVGTGVKPATISLDNHKKATFQIQDVEAVKDDLNPCWSQFAPVAGKAVAKAMTKTVTDLLTYSNAEAQVTVAKAALKDATAWRALVEAQGYDPADCVLMLTPAAFADLVALVPNSVIGNGDAVAMGKVAEFVGFKAVMESPNLSTASDGEGATKGIGFVVPTGAIGIAARTVPAIKGVAAGLVDYAIITDDETGVSFDQRVVVDANLGTCNWTVESLYGAALTKQSSNGAPGYLQLITA